MSQEDRAQKRTMTWGVRAWNRHRMNKTHIKGKRKSKKFVRRAVRRVGQVKARDES